LHKLPTAKNFGREEEKENRMSAFLILFVMAAWGASLFGLGYLLTFPIKKKWIRALVGVAAVATFFTLPVRDELKGKEEFEALCAAGGVYQISPKTEGKKLDLMFNATPYKALTGYARPVSEKTVSYFDASTGEVVASAKAYSAGGGWLVQKKIIVLTSTDGPLIGRSQCFPPDSEEARRQQITSQVLN
jgi:hypothetical protein